MPDRLRGVYGARERAYSPICVCVCVCVYAQPLRFRESGKNASISTFSVAERNRCVSSRGFHVRRYVHVRMHGAACTKVARRLRAEWHSRQCGANESERASLCVNKPVHTHTDTRVITGVSRGYSSPIAKDLVARERISQRYIYLVGKIIPAIRCFTVLRHFRFKISLKIER